jgi:predicted  nucleic acid-binding Zn-ribbon protein
MGSAGGPGVPLRCVDCGTVWQSAPAARVAAAHGGCLTCGGELVPVRDDDAGGGEDEEAGPGG